MLQPKRTKYRKPFIQRHDKRKATKGNKVSFGEFGLQAVTSAWVTARQIESARIAATRRMGREGEVIIRIFPHFAKTSKPIGVRMGSGKGTPELWYTAVKVNTVMFEVSGVAEDVARDALRLAGHKLPVKWKIIKREEGDK
ncbi:50S ribosomal protein L16 [Mycoplasma sp. 2045]|uniref:50S ribosomal protein L16 n=1 Tax=unclassified Mycoplasma TaxID=2683645 RepID=UPI00211B762F|nr:MULTISPECIES: 50S ribosomal protein L16 [unclassified Mycoplasma]MEA4134555.1 50S ribosomal protein L16 [Mycoplasma sp. 2704]MEA4162778.1 50S ribosomal protein L16 [Mycoplasma sp. 4404]MEA4190944.1 50S ribosomal protein L16 [Mycoplasma sp. 2248]MEA4206350.1 50S ribosomal protein L16 [Mycoplasma sp. 1199]MEA4276509.1 50S ribosomal protein L16 [Mycoplasma sp. 21DD0573]